MHLLQLLSSFSMTWIQLPKGEASERYLLNSKVPHSLLLLPLTDRFNLISDTFQVFLSFFLKRRLQMGLHNSLTDFFF